MALRALALITILALPTAQAAPFSAAHNFDLTRAVPLDTGDVKLPESYASAEEAFGDLQRHQLSGNFFVIMEVTRRAQQSLSDDESRKFLDLVKGQYQRQFDSPLYYFEQGYAQYVMRRNPTGLLLMRAADKHLASPATALAVAMAQAEIELEQGEGGESTPRFEEAWRRHLLQPTSGFTHSFERVIEKLAIAPVYRDQLLARVPMSSGRASAAEAKQ